MKHLILFFFSLTLSTQVFAQPAGYYNSASGLTGEPLKAELNNIIDGHTAYSYSNLWTILQVTDADPNNSNNVIGFYSRFSMNAAAAYDNGNGWNREHSWAKSKGGFGTSTGAGTDLHHMRVSDISTNGARNNRLFDDGGTTYVDNGGTYSGTTPCKEGSAWSWEPGADQKGDVARMLFYMATRYEGENGEVDLEMTEELLSSTDNRPLHGKLSTLLAWHTADPVSAEEISRNEIVYGYQNNRNPYIDHPEYVDSIWGGNYVPGNGGGGNPPAGTSAATLLISDYVEGASNNKAIEFFNYGTAAVDLSTVTLKKQTNGAGAWSTAYTMTGSLAAAGVYVVANSSAAAGLTTLADVTTTDAVMSFNGNDAIGLFVNDTLVDVIGTFDGGSSNFAANETWARDTTIAAGNTVFTTSEWIVLAQDDFTGIGAHSGASGSGGGSGGGNPPANGAVLISEYVEGSSYNKAIEITNYSNAAVDLSAYVLKKQSNGSGAWTSGTALSGTLAPNAVFVIAHTNGDAALLAVADMTSNGSEINFNGNDPIGLFFNGTLVDVIGTFDGGSSNFAKDKTVRRIATVVDANTTYTTSEWTFHSNNDFSNVGTNNGSSSIATTNENEMSNTSLTVSTYTNDNKQIVVGTDASAETMVTVQVYSMTGQLMINTKSLLNPNEKVSFDTTGWNAGVYIIHHTAEGKMGMNKVRI